MGKAGTVQSGAEKAGGDLTDLHKYLEGGCKEARARLSSVGTQEPHQNMWRSSFPVG